MSILEFSHLKYSYNDKQIILRDVSGRLESGRLPRHSRSLRLR